jgi:hypothetical protein
MALQGGLNIFLWDVSSTNKVFSKGILGKRQKKSFRFMKNMLIRYLRQEVIIFKIESFIQYSGRWKENISFLDDYIQVRNCMAEDPPYNIFTTPLNIIFWSILSNLTSTQIVVWHHVIERRITVIVWPNLLVKFKQLGQTRKNII